MQDERFDFAYRAGAWTWSHVVKSQVVRTSTGTFGTLYDCVDDARGAGFNASAGSQHRGITHDADLPPVSAAA